MLALAVGEECVGVHALFRELEREEKARAEAGNRDVALPQPKLTFPGKVRIAHQHAAPRAREA